MKMKTKTCKKCGNTVEVTAKYCQKCGSNEFIQKAEVVVQRSQPSTLHKLFYWDYDGQYMLSKSKLAGISAFLLLASMCVLSNAPVAIIVIGAIIGALIFFLGFAIHNLRSNPSKSKLDYNDYGFLQDLYHLLFFWQNKKTGQFVLSKTKIISHLIFLLFAAIACFLPTAKSLFAIILFGMFFEAPAFLIGYGIHKLTNPYPVNPKREIPKPKEMPKPKPEIKRPVETPGSVPEYMGYKSQIEDMIREYNVKEAHTRDLIEKRFEPPQLTYSRFIGVVDKSTKMFNHQSDSALTMINLANDYSPKIENEIKSKISVLRQIISKLDDLTNELVLTMEKSDDNEINSLFDDMSNLINSVNDYD